MKKTIKTLIVLCCFVLFCLMMTSCGHEHAFGDWVTIKDATCTEDGSQERTCECGQKDTQTIPAQGHTPGAAATCTTAQACTVCNVELAAATGHTPGAAATCTTAQTCTACNVELAKATGHTYGEWQTTQAATCIAEGIREKACSCGVKVTERLEKTGHTPNNATSCISSQVCTVCNVTLSAATGHNTVYDAAVSPTCTRTGLTAGSHCSKCNEVFVAQVEIPTVDHDPVTDRAIEPTCTEPGLTEGSHCWYCDTVIVEQVVLSPLGHSVLAPIESEGLFTEENDANYPFAVQNGVIMSTNKSHGSSATYTITATEAFVLKLQYIVSSEGADRLYIYHNDVQKVQASGTEVTEVRTKLINMEAGDTVTITYSKDYSVNLGEDCAIVQISAVQRAEATEEFIATLTPLCAEDICCEHCEEIMVEQVGHVEVIDDAVEPTRTENGLTEGKHCSVCGMTIVEQEVIYAIGSAGLEFELNTDGESYTVTGIGTATDTDIYIPAMYNGFAVTAIGERAFSAQTQITELYIPDTVTTIGSRAFYGCTGLTEITIPASVTSIGTQVFYTATNLSTVYYNSTYYSSSNQFLNLSSIKKIVFGGSYVPGYMCQNFNSLEEVVVEDGVRYIDYDAFYGCTALKSIEISESVTAFNSYAFSSCSALEAVYYRGTVEKWLGISISSNPCANGAALYLEGELVSEIVIPGTVETIGTAFAGCSSLTSVVISDGVKTIGSSAFSGCTNLTTVVIADTVETIGESAFRGCTSLTAIEIPDSVSSIGSSAFYGCTGLTAIEIPDSVSSIGSSAFCGCTGLTTVEIPDSVSSIDSHVFSGCTGLTSVEIADSVTTIGSSAFYNCDGLTSIVIPDSVTSIGQYAFKDCDSLASVTIGSGVTSIGYDAFYSCNSLIEVINHSSLEITAGSYNYGYVAYYAIEVHDGESKIDNRDGYVFYTYDDVIYLVAYPSNTTDIVLPDYDNQEYTIYGSLFAYNDNLTSLTVNGIVNIGDDAFYDCDGLTSVTLGKGVASIGYEAFLSCDNLETVTIAGGDIGSYAFSSCYNLTSVTFGGAVTSIGASAFYNCDGLTSIVIPDSVTSIGSYAFQACDGLMSVTLGSGVTSIGSYAFESCYKLIEVINKSALNLAIGNYGYGYVAYYASEIHNGTSKIENRDGYLFYSDGENGYLLGYVGEETDLVLPESYRGGTYIIYQYAFYNRDDLTSVTISDGVTSIGYNAFYDCDGLTSAVIGKNVTNIGSYAFQNCGSLMTVTYTGTADQWSNVTKYYNWLYYTSVSSIICSDSIVSA